MHPDPSERDPFPQDAQHDLHPGTPDVATLRRRVLVTGALTLLAWVCALVLLDALGLGPAYALLAALVLYLVLVRPMMRPVRDAVRLRRRLAYQAWLDSRDADETGDGGAGEGAGDGAGRG